MDPLVQRALYDTDPALKVDVLRQLHGIFEETADLYVQNEATLFELLQESLKVDGDLSTVAGDFLMDLVLEHPDVPSFFSTMLDPLVQRLQSNPSSTLDILKTFTRRHHKPNIVLNALMKVFFSQNVCFPHISLNVCLHTNYLPLSRQL
jgi:hypothetical protein